jgi:hypothetical protein
MNSEELARQAGAVRHIGSTPNWTIDTSDLERFAALVLEQAAQKCDELGDPMDEVRPTPFELGSQQCAEAIRAMKPTQGE